MSNGCRRWSMCGALVAVLFAAEGARADDSPSNAIHRLVQRGQDVEVTLRIGLLADGYHEVYRWQDQGEQLLGFAELLEESDLAACSAVVDEEWGAECAFYGDAPIFYAFTDECVPPGEIRYRLDNGVARMITVEDTGARCGPVEDCSVSGIGARGSPGGALALVLLGLGLVALRASGGSRRTAARPGPPRRRG